MPEVAPLQSSRFGNRLSDSASRRKRRLVLGVGHFIVLAGLALGLLGLGCNQLRNADQVTLMQLGVSSYFGLIAILSIELGFGTPAHFSLAKWFGEVSLGVGVIVCSFLFIQWNCYYSTAADIRFESNPAKAMAVLLAISLPGLSACCALPLIAMRILRGVRFARGNSLPGYSRKELKVELATYCVPLLVGVAAFQLSDAVVNRGGTRPPIDQIAIACLGMFALGGMVLVPMAGLIVNAHRLVSLATTGLTIVGLVALASYVEIEGLLSGSKNEPDAISVGAMLFGPLALLAHLWLVRNRGYRLARIKGTAKKRRRLTNAYRAGSHGTK